VLYAVPLVFIICLLTPQQDAAVAVGASISILQKL
jgi:hypothetical protein